MLFSTLREKQFLEILSIEFHSSFFNSTYIMSDLPIRNRVAEAGIYELNLLELQPELDIETLDISQFLHEGLILIEKEFKAAMQQFDWSIFSEKIVCLTCTNDAIIPQWAYLIIAEKLKGIAQEISLEKPEAIQHKKWKNAIKDEDFSTYNDQKVTLKASVEVPEAIYLAAALELMPIVKTLMYGEPGLPKVVFKKK